MQTNSFTIENTVLKIPKTVEDSLFITSSIKNYQVIFKRFNSSFSENDILLVDKKVRELYKIKHKKIIEIKALEKNKSIETVLSIIDKLIAYKATKKNTLVVIGGGITQELGSFVAKIFKRGINWIFYPTTLVSQCDSCLGGKASLNYKQSKNQLGVFSPPDEIIVDTNFLNTLEKKDLISGYGEVLKSFLIAGDFYLKNLSSWSQEKIVKHTLSIKKAIIECDEFESLERKALNLGHSFGHAIEGLTKYKIPHGEAVLLGIKIVNQIFEKNQKISKLIDQYTSLEKIKNLSPKELTNFLLSDKKTLGNKISLVRIKKPGSIFFSPLEINLELEEKVREIFPS